MNYQKKVLCIGCSHLSGAYDQNDNLLNYESWAWHLWTLRNKQEKFFIIPNPGQGLLQYSATIELLSQNNLLDQFDYAIIQLTSEPRITWFDSGNQKRYYVELLNFIKRNEEVFNTSQQIYAKYCANHSAFSSGHRKLFSLYEKQFVTDSSKNNWLSVTESIWNSIVNNDLLNLMFPVFYKYIINELTKYNIKPIIFDWWGQSEFNYRTITELSKDFLLFDQLAQDGSIKGLLSKNNLWKREEQSVGGHMNSDQNKIIASYINKEIIRKELMS